MSYCYYSLRIDSVKGTALHHNEDSSGRRDPKACVLEIFDGGALSIIALDLREPERS